MHLTLDHEELRAIVMECVQQTLQAMDWPTGKLALSEGEASEAVGVCRHVLRDARLRHELKYSSIGRKIVYQRADLVEWLARTREGGNGR